MAVTRAQANAGVAGAILEVFEHYPEARPFIVRVLVSRAKQVGTVQARDILRAVLRELYRSAFSDVDPASTANLRHQFRHWMSDALDPMLTDDPLLGLVDASDAFTAVAEDIV